MVKNKVCSLGLSAALAVVMASVSLAYADSVSQNTTLPGPQLPSIVSPSTPEPSMHDRIAGKVALSYWVYYKGAQVNDLGNRYQPGADGNLDTGSVQSLENIMTTGWKFSKNWMVGVIAHSYYSPIGNPTAQGTDNWEWLDPAITLSRNSLIDLGGGLKVKPSLSATLPMSQYDRLKTDGLVTGITPLLNTFYDVPGTQLTLGLYSYFTIYVPGSNAIDHYRSFKIVMAPNANYQLTKTVAATVWVDAINVRRAHHTGIISGMNNPYMDVEPGINWDVTSYFSVNPFLNIYPESPTISATSFQLVLTGKVF